MHSCCFLFEYEVNDGYGLEEERIRSKIDWDKKAKHKAGPREIGTTKGYKRAKVIFTFYTNHFDSF